MASGRALGITTLEEADINKPPTLHLHRTALGGGGLGYNIPE